MNGNPRARLFADERRADARDDPQTTRHHDRGVFMISVAAELAEMHPQTLRMYEARGLIEPKRSPKGTRLYSQDDVERLRRIQEMTTELGLNLAGVERVLELEEQLERALDAAWSSSRGAARRMRDELQAEILRVRALLRGELVPIRRWVTSSTGRDPPGATILPCDPRSSVTIRMREPPRRRLEALR